MKSSLASITGRKQISPIDKENGSYYFSLAAGLVGWLLFVYAAVYIVVAHRRATGNDCFHYRSAHVGQLVPQTGSLSYKRLREMENKEVDNELHATTHFKEAAANVSFVSKPAGRGQPAECYPSSTLQNQALAPLFLSVPQMESSRGQFGNTDYTNNLPSATTSCTDNDYGSNARRQLGVYHNLIEEDEL